MAGSKVLGFALLALGVVLFILGIMMGPWLSSYLDRQFKKAGKGACTVDDLQEEWFLQPHSDCDGCAPMYFGFYPFDLGNADDFLQSPASVKPVFNEKGPYMYRRNVVRVNPQLDGDLVTFKSYNRWSFDESMSSGAETDMFTKIDLGYLAVTTSTGGELNFIDSLLTSLMALRGQAFDVSLVPNVAKMNVMKLINGINSWDPATMLASVAELAPILSPETDPLTYIAQLSVKTFDGFYYNGVFIRRTVKQWFLGQPSFIAGLAIGSQYPSCVAPIPEAGGMSLLDICESCSGAACHQYWSECSTCRQAKAIMSSSDALCDQLEAELTASLGEQQAGMVVGATCRLCATQSLFCIAQLPGEVEGSGLDYNVVPVDESTLNAYTIDQGCSDVSMYGRSVMRSNRTATALWMELAEGQDMPSVFDLMSFGRKSWCDSDVQDGVRCEGFIGTAGQAFEPAGVDMQGLGDELAFGQQDVFVTQAMMNVTLFPTGETVETQGIDLKRLRVSPDGLSRTPWNEDKGVGFPVDGLACLAFQFGFLLFMSRPMFVHADKSLLDNVRFFQRDGTEITRDTPDADLVDTYDTLVDVEPASGLSMRANKRLMATVALTTEAVPGSTTATSNLVNPTMPANVIMPLYWVDEQAEIPSDSADSFKHVVRLSRAMLPVLVVGVVLGVLLWNAAGFILNAASKGPDQPSPSPNSVETASHPSANSIDKDKPMPLGSADQMPAQFVFLQPQGPGQPVMGPPMQVQPPQMLISSVVAAPAGQTFA